MKLALFGRNTEYLNLDNLNLLIEKLMEYPGVELCFYKPFCESVGYENCKCHNFNTFSSNSDLPDDINLFLSLGGDGTFLESLTFIRNRDIPVAGINFGRLGFLTTARVEEDNEWIGKLL